MSRLESLLEIDGKRMLTDPVWGERVSPVAFAEPKRFHPVPAELMMKLAPTDAPLIMPRLGQPIEPHQVQSIDPWWRENEETGTSPSPRRWRRWRSPSTEPLYFGIVC